MAGSLCGSAWADQISSYVGTDPAKEIDKDARYLIVQDFGTSAGGKFVYGMELQEDGTYKAIVKAFDATIESEDLNKYSWAITENEYKSISQAIEGYSYSFTNSLNIPLRVNKGATPTELTIVTNPSAEEGTYYDEFGFGTWAKYSGENTTSLALLQPIGSDYLYMQFDATQDANTIQFNTTYTNSAITFYEINPSEQSDEDLNKLYNKKGFNLTVGDGVEGNLFNDPDVRIIAVDVDNNYTLSKAGVNGKDLIIPAGTYFFTDLVLKDDVTTASNAISEEDVDWLASTVIMVSPTDLVESTVDDSEVGQGFKLTTVNLGDPKVIYEDNTSTFKVGDLPIWNAAFNVKYNNVDKYDIYLEKGEFFYRANATDDDTKTLKKSESEVTLSVLTFTSGDKYLTTIPNAAANKKFAFSFSNVAIEDGKLLLNETATPAIYNIQFVQGNAEDKDLIGKYLTNGHEDDNEFNWVAKPFGIVDLNTPAFQYTITSVEPAAGAADNADTKYINVTFTNRETNESFTAQLFKEDEVGELCYSLAFDKDNAIDEVTPVEIDRNGYGVDKQAEVDFDEYVIVKLIKVNEVDEFAGFYNVDDKVIRTIRFARDKHITSSDWYMGVYDNTLNKDGSHSETDNYFVEDAYDAAQFQLVKVKNEVTEQPEVNTIARTFVYYNTTTKDVDDVPNADKVSAYTYQLRYVEDGTETDYYLTSDASAMNLKENPTEDAEFIIKENADGSVSIMAKATNKFTALKVAPAHSKIAIDAVPTSDGEYLKYQLDDYVYAYESEDNNIKTYLDDKIPVISWMNEGYVTLQNITRGINGDYISMNEKNEGILVENADIVLTVNKTADEGIIPSFFISKWIGEGAERAYMFNPVDSVMYQVNKEYDPTYMLSKGRVKAMFINGVLNEAHDQMTVNVKGENRVIEAEANAAATIWAGLNRMKFQIVQNIDGAYIIRQAGEDVYDETKGEKMGIEDDKTYYLASQNDYLYLTNTKEEAMEIEVVETDMPTSNESIADEAEAGVQVIAGNGQVEIQGAAGKNVVIANILGKVVANTVLTSDNATITVPAGIVVVTVEGETAVKAVVK